MSIATTPSSFKCNYIIAYKRKAKDSLIFSFSRVIWKTTNYIGELVSMKKYLIQVVYLHKKGNYLN